MRNIFANLQKMHLLSGMKYILIFFYSVLLVSDFAIAEGEREKQFDGFEFALIGDMPYDGEQRKEFVQLIKGINSADLAFVVHNGDFWFDGIVWNKTMTGLPPCSDATFKDRFDLAHEFKHPFVFIPGDNDWTDCYRAKPHTYDPIERLDMLRQTFFQSEYSLGKRTMSLTRQSDDDQYAKYRENVRWTYGDVLFVTLHMIGSNNNYGRTTGMDAEFTVRNAANLAWMKEAFELAKRKDNKAIMIIAHANPQFENTWPAKLQKRYMLNGLAIKPPETTRETGFDDFLAALEEETLAYGKPVVYVHGDTHTFRIDKPLIGSFSQRIIENFTRIETFGYKDTHWIRAIVDPDDPNVFSFRQEIVAENRVIH